MAESSSWEENQSTYQEKALDREEASDERAGKDLARLGVKSSQVTSR